MLYDEVEVSFGGLDELLMDQYTGNAFIREGRVYLEQEELSSFYEEQENI